MLNHKLSIKVNFAPVYIFNYLRHYLLLYRQTFSKYKYIRARVYCMVRYLHKFVRHARWVDYIYILYNIILLGSNRKSTPCDSITAICTP